MNTTWMSLVYKEWHEQKWKLVALAVILLAVPTVLTLVNERREWPGMVFGVLMMYGVLAGLFIGMAVAAGENSHRTMRFLQSLPIPTWQAALVKLAVALVVVIVPLLILSVVMFAVINFASIDVRWIQTYVSRSFNESVEVFIVLQFLASILGTSSLLIWVAAVGVNRSDEIRAGAIGFLVCASLWMLFFWVAGHFNVGDPLSFVALLVPAYPGGLAFLMPTWRSENVEMWVAVLICIPIAVLGHGALLWWYLRRFGRVPVPPKHTAGWEFSLRRPRQQPGLPFRSPWRAILWSQLRQTGPLAMLSAATVLIVAVAVSYFNRDVRNRTDFAVMLAGIALMAGWFVTLVTGIGLFLDDLAPGVNTFWRSRPVKVTQWFFVKYFTALVVLLVAFGGLIVLAWWLGGLDFNYHSNRKGWIITGEILTFVWIFVLLYTLAAAGYVLVRQPIYAAILAMGALALCVVLINHFDGSNTTILDRVVLFVIWASSLPAAVLLAWQAVKRDWGWKARR